MLLRVLGGFLIVVLAGCGDSAVDGADGGAPDGAIPDGGVSVPLSVVVDVDWLVAHLDDPNLQPVDTRVPPAFDAGRIPGAIHLMPSQLADPEGSIPSQILPREQAEQKLRAAGLRNDTMVVVYGEPPEYDPARVVWALRYYGHRDVHYLDGGYPAWMQAGGTVESETPLVVASEYTITAINEDLRVTGDWVESELGSAPYDMPAIQLVDARSPTEYEAGRIPSARHVQWTRNLDGGLLRPKAAIEALHDGFDPSVTTVAYCFIGLRGSFAWLALTHLGYEDVRLYDGSWAEWGNGEFPVEQ